MMRAHSAGPPEPLDLCMAKKLKGASPEPNPGPMPWQDFVLGFEVANEALQSLNEPALRPPFVQPVSHPGRRDPFRWVSVAVARHFGPTYPHLASFQHRFWGLMQLLDSGSVSEWVQSGEDAAQRRLHPAVLLAAAEVRLTRNGKFPARRFASRVEEIIRTELDAPADGDEGTA